MERAPELVILGGGLCGLSAAYHSKGPWSLYEVSDRVGGLALSERIRGHTFDCTGHWLHLADDRMRRLVSRLLGDRLIEVSRRSRIFSHGVLTRYPFQANLHGLPSEVVFECLRGFLDRQERRPATRGGASERGRSRAGGTFEDLILSRLGAGIAEHFMIPYNEKLWGVHPRELTDAWCRRFVPLPDRDQVLRGALGAAPGELGYNVTFQYPSEGGIELLPQALAARLPPGRLHCNAGVEAIDHSGRRLRIGDEWRSYGALVATLPLPSLCRLLVRPPKAVVRAAERLRWTSVRYLNVGLRRSPPEDYHWVYVPERRYPAYRVGVFTSVAPSMAPDEGGSLYVELASQGEENRDTLVAQCLPMLEAAGAIHRRGDVRFAELRRIEHAYVIFDEAWGPARQTLLDFFEAHDIYPRGRYGRWDYGSMEDAMLEGREVAKLLATRYIHGPDAPD